MHQDWISALLSIAGLAVNACAQVGYMRLAARPLYLNSVLFGFAAGLLAVAGGETALAALFGLTWDRACLAFANLAAYGILSYCYVAFLTLGVSALRIRMLNEVAERPDGLPREELLARYDAQAIIDTRLGRLVDKRQISLSGGRYRYAGSPVIHLHRVIGLCRLVLFGSRNKPAPPGGAG
jgi:hypothetical protein